MHAYMHAYTVCSLASILIGSLAVNLLGMTSSGRVLDLIMQRRCCLQCFLPPIPLLWLPRIVLSSSSSTLLLHWDVVPLGA